MLNICFCNAKILIQKAFSPRFLFYTNVGLSTCLSATGDFIEQSYEVYSGELESLDIIRSRNMSVSGVTLGVFGHFWYNYLDKWIPSTNVRRVVKKIIVDQTIGTPIGILVFFGTLAIMENAPNERLIAEIQEKGWRLYVADCLFGPPAQFINFYYLPTRYRVLYDNTVSLGFDIYTSYVKNAIPLKNEVS